MLFGMLSKGPLKQLEHDLQHEGLCLQIHTAGVLSSEAEVHVHAPLASWHDDLVLMIATDGPSALLPGVSFALRRAHDLLPSATLCLTSRLAKRKFSACLSAEALTRSGGLSAACRCLTAHSFPIARAIARLVDRYRHLGSWICDSGFLLPEIRHRLYARAS